MFPGKGFLLTKWGAGAAAAAVAPVGLILAFASTNKKEEVVELPKPLTKAEWTRLRVVDVKQETHDVKVVTFALPDAGSTRTLGSDPIVNVHLRTMVKGKPIVRPYNPITPSCAADSFDLAVKKYVGSQMGTFVHSLEIGDEVEVKGPNQQVKFKANEHSHVGLIAGGTGLTPLMQLLESSLADSHDKTQFTVLCANKTEGDILLRKRLDQLAATYPKRVSVHHTIETAPKGWTGLVGRVDAKMITSVLPAPATSTKIFVCGPAAMTEAIAGPKAKDWSQGELEGALKAAGYSKANVWKV